MSFQSFGVSSIKGLSTGGGGISTAALEDIHLYDRKSTFVGKDAFEYNSAGILNSILGYEAVGAQSATVGDAVNAFGTYSLYHNRGSFNSAFGTRSGYNNQIGFNNTYMGHHSGFHNIEGSDQVFIGFESGLNTLGGRNIFVGSLAGYEASTTSNNIGIGYNANTTGGDSITLGADSITSGSNSISIGDSISTSGSNSIILGPNITSSGSKSLIILPRKDGLPYTSTQNEHLNIYNTLLGEREITGNYKTTLKSDKVVLENAHNRINLDMHGMSFYSDHNVTYLSPAIYTNGFKVVSGNALFDVPVTFEGPIDIRGATTFKDITQASITDASISNATIKDLRVTGNTTFDNSRFEDLEVLGTTKLIGPSHLYDVRTATLSNATMVSMDVQDADIEALFVSEEAQFDGQTYFHGGVEIAHKPLEAEEIDSDKITTRDLVIEGQVTFCNTITWEDLNVNNGYVKNLTTKTSHIQSNLTVDGDILSSGKLYSSEFISSNIITHGLVASGPTFLHHVKQANIENAAVSNASIQVLSVSDELEVNSESTFYKKGVFKSGLHVCCQPLEAEEIESHTIRTHHLYVDGDFSVSNAKVYLKDVDIDEGRITQLIADSISVLSNVTIDGDLIGSGELYYPNAFFGEVNASNISAGGGISSSTLNVGGPAYMQSLNVSGPIISASLDTDHIVCKTIRVEGGQPLYVRGNSYLNSTFTSNLEVFDQAILEKLYVHTEVNTGSLYVRGATIMGNLSCCNLLAERIDADWIEAQDIRVQHIEGLFGAFSNLKFTNEFDGPNIFADGNGFSASNGEFSNLVSHNPTFPNGLGDVFGGTATFCNVVAGNLTLQGGVDLSDISFHDVSLTGLTQAEGFHCTGDARVDGDLEVGGKITADQLEITNGFFFDTNFPFEFNDDVVVNDNLIVKGESSFQDTARFQDAYFESISTKDFEVNNKAYFDNCLVLRNDLDLTGKSLWDICLSNKTTHSADLQLKSSNGAIVKFVDNFDPSVLNFTGQHRCVVEQNDIELLPGMLLSCTGELHNLDGSKKPNISDSLPVLKLCNTERDKKCFGVFVKKEPKGKAIFKLGNLVFDKSCDNKKFSIVNSVGEGSMWICDSNGIVEVGDLLESSSVPGFAQKQIDDVIRSTTVAKVTSTPEWIDTPFMRKAFTAVVYRF